MDGGDGASFFCRDRPDGKFEIKNVPAGTYVIEAWHEKLESKTATVTVKDNASSKNRFYFFRTERMIK